MRRKVSGLVKVRAISGTHVIFLAFDMKESDTKGLMGFAIQRTDLTEDETTWLRGNKTFRSIRPTSGFEDASSHEHPFQAFQWADYTAKPGYNYRYRVIPMYGKPGALTEKASTTVAIGTEPLTGARHEVHFNRSAIASQAFARRFLGQTLDEAGEPAYAWLGRDLVPALLEFIAKARGRGSGHGKYLVSSRIVVLRPSKVGLYCVFRGQKDRFSFWGLWREKMTFYSWVHLAYSLRESQAPYNGGFEAQNLFQRPQRIFL